MLKSLKKLLNEVQTKSGSDFSGVGIIVHDRAHDLPIFPLRLSYPMINETQIVDSLIKIASKSSKYHDGFHLISKDWKLTHVSQYFSPPIVEKTEVDRSKLFGGRYLAALFGSSLPDVLFTGIASSDFGVAIFKSGKEIYYKKGNNDSSSSSK